MPQETKRTARITFDTSELRALLREVQPHLSSLTADQSVELRKFLTVRGNLFTCHSDYDPARRTGNVRVVLKPRQEFLEFVTALRAGQDGGVPAEYVAH